MHVSDKAALAELFPTFIPLTFNPLSHIDSMNGAQMSRNIVSENRYVARQPIGDPATVVLV